MIRVGAVLDRLTEHWPKVAPGPLPDADSVPLPTTPDAITDAVAAAEKRYRKSHRRRVCLVSPDGCHWEQNVESMRQ